jgi:alanine racemase
MQRRGLLKAGAGLAAFGAGRALAAPILSAGNFGLTLPAPPGATAGSTWMPARSRPISTRCASGPAARLCAVMKADAYGNGIALLIPSILRKRVSDVAITSNDEARVARQLGFRGRLIRIRTATPEEMEDGFAHGITELIANPLAAERLQALWLKRKPKRPLSVHIALNAGDEPQRRGAFERLWAGRRPRAAGAQGSARTGAMTHYPSEEAADILGQLGRFQDDLRWLASAGLDTRPLLRTANTFATLEHPETRLDMVRVGGAIYGDPGSTKTDKFQPTMAIKSRVTAVNHYPAGQTVNYDRTYRLDRESWLANIPIGYSDGYRRGFSHANRPEFEAESRNRTEVLIGGRRFPVVGRVTMNTMMADVTGWQDKVRLDDEVVLFGAQGAERITQPEFERNGSVYGPEALTVMGATLPRVLKAG